MTALIVPPLLDGSKEPLAVVDAFPDFRPVPCLRGAHRQTISATYLSRPAPIGRPLTTGTVQHHIDLPDGDQLVAQDDQPRGWQTSDPVTILVHGLSGCHASNYLVRTASRLLAVGVRTFRIDMRGCGAGWDVANQSMHAGRSDDMQAAIRYVADLCPASPRGAVGFSLGGATLLRAIAQHNQVDGRSLKCAMAVSPPIDLQACSDSLRLPRNRMYDRTMARWLYRYVMQRRDSNAEIAELDTGKRPRSIYDFDRQFTAPLGRFASVEAYYKACSVRPVLGGISIPTLMLTAQDDPLVPFHVFRNAPISSTTRLYAPQRGGHVGFLGRCGSDPDGWWLDWRIVDWILAGCNRPANT